MLALITALSALAHGAPLPEGLHREDRVVMGAGLAFLGAVLPEEVAAGSTLELDLYFEASAPLPPDTLSFVHLEGLDTTCRLVEDRRPPAPEDGLIRHRVSLRVPQDGACANARLELFTGLYDRQTGKRVEVVTPRSLDDRIHAGRVAITAITTAPRAIPPSAMQGAELWARVRPWTGWLLGLALAALLVVFLRNRALPLPDAPPLIANRRLRGLLIGLILGVPLVLTFLAALDFIKDDAYISFRYAHNIVTGDGLVFNPGERVEGITNFLWTVLMVPFEALGLDLFQVSEALGLALSAGIILYLVRLSALFTSDTNGHSTRYLAVLWGGVWLATSSSLGLWSHSGMEQALAMFLPIVAAWLLWRDTVPTRRAAFWSGLFMGLGCLTRPELHAIAFCLGLPLVIDTLRKRRLAPETLAWFGGLLIVIIPVHAFRYAYYGSLVPNTFYVKTGDSTLVWLEGLKKLHEMFGFNATGVLAVLAPLALLSRHRLTEKLVSAMIAGGFMVFLVKVGVDEMHWHRLYLPALPFLALLAATGLINLVHLASSRARASLRPVLWNLGWTLVIAASALNFAFTYREMSGFNGRGDLSGNFHPDMGKFLTRHDRPGALVAFQDMGSTPYHAPDIAFLDFIGLVDHTVARARYSYGLHAFMATESSRRQPEFDAEMRAYFYARNPEWTILTTYIPTSEMDAVSKRFATNPVPASLGPALRSNGYQFGLVDATFDARYVHVRTWPRSAGYYLSLYRRRDLWEKTPGEVVLDAAPPDLGGPQASFAGGLELLGAEVEPVTKARHEAFVTTWWRVPGPMPADTWFFLHIENDKQRVPYDALPGDWMYPADRWKPGQIIEHRTLFQVPPDMKPGDYRVMAGVYRRRTGDRVAFTTGPNDGQQRVDLGPLRVEPLRPPFDSLIKPTDITAQRRHPERIIDHGRQAP
jgi:hypothetical protein